jgi:hypothetical protein
MLDGDRLRLASSGAGRYIALDFPLLCRMSG